MIKVEILSLGNELLIGRTVNTNATKIALELSKRGYFVTRETSLRDDEDQILLEFDQITKRGADILVITGGLGVTQDDMQLECIAKYTRQPLELNNQAEEWLKERLKQDELPDAVRKMILLPKESIALKNNAGAAPGVETRVGNQIWYSLPGVPREMIDILVNQILPRIDDLFGIQIMDELGFTAYGMKEPQVVSTISQAKLKYPEIHFKSHPKKDEQGSWLELHVTVFGDASEEIAEATKYWKSLIDDIPNVKTTDIHKIFDEAFVPEKFDN
ncbi:MAG: competence/damage-inducible protein A [Candidatus Heimdallarchaeota archaeon]|nr:competence/damage-inducible protein A [Candidatus Heimdallarchaeota archaeon]